MWSHVISGGPGFETVVGSKKKYGLGLDNSSFASFVKSLLNKKLWTVTHPQHCKHDNLTALLDLLDGYVTNILNMEIFSKKKKTNKHKIKHHRPSKLAYTTFTFEKVTKAQFKTLII